MPDQPHHSPSPDPGQGEAFYSDGWEHVWLDMKTYSPVGRHTRRWIRRFLHQIPPPTRLCDFGSGDGSLLKEVSKEFPGILLHGVDFSTTSVQRCAQRIPNAIVKQHDLQNPTLPFEEIMDVGICSEVIEHIPDHEAAVRTLARSCRHLILTVPSGPLDEMSRQIGHLRHYEAEPLTRMLEAEGHEVIQIKCWGFPLAYPWYAAMRNRSGYSTVTGAYGPGKKMLTNLLYFLFFFNDLFNQGNKIFLLSRSTSR